MAKRDKTKPAEISDTEEKLAEETTASEDTGDVTESETESAADASGDTTVTDGADTVEDAEILEDAPSSEAETTDAVDAESEMADASAESPAEAPVSDADPVADEAVADTETLNDEVGEPAELADQPSAEDTVSEVEPESAHETQPEAQPEVETIAAAAPEVIRETVIEKKAGFMPMLLGGIVAGGIGFGVGQYGGLIAPPENPFEAEARAALDAQSTTLTAQAEQIEVLTAQLADAQKAIEIVDTAPLTAAVAGLEDGLTETSEAVSGLSDQVAGFDSRMTAIEKQPLANALSPEAIAAYERELEELRATITDQRTAMEAQQAEVADIVASGGAVTALQASVADLNARIDALAEDNAAAEAAAADKEARAATLVALADVTAAVQSGDPFAEALGTLAASGIEIPAAVSAVAEGLPTQAALIEAFPDLARAALKEARSSGTADEGASGLGNFFKNQLGARSVTPREGDDADAVLSRAEAAAAAGDLDTALTEVAALPDGVRAIFDDWSAMADSRKAALAALDGLTQTVTQE